MSLVDLLFPRRCPVCHQIVSGHGRMICPGCETKLSYIKDPVCFRCGKMLSSQEEEYCGDCVGTKRSFQWNTALLTYDNTARETKAEELAKVLGQKLGIPVRPELLKRGRNTEALKTLSPAGRYQSLAGAFQAGRKKCPYSSVLLVDDIYTTGATMEGCSRVLREMGAEKIYGVTVCIGRGDG